MNRRSLLAALAFSAFGPALAHAGPSRTPLADAFLLLEEYLKLPAAKRDLFHFSYLARRKGKPAADAKATYVLEGGTRTPVVFAADGEVTNPPTLEQLKSKATFEADGPPLDFALEMRVTAIPAAHLEADGLVRALAQANAAVAVFMEGQAARLTHAYFPDAGAGRAVYADGHATALAAFEFPNLGPILYLDLSRAAGLAAVELDHAPSRVMLAGPPRRT
jgi:hypothetical protein